MEKLRLYWKLIKSPQTTLLLSTGLAGYMSARCPVFNLITLLSAAGSLFLAISGSTVLNMWYDRDLDAAMKRSCTRPLPSGQISPRAALCLGLALSAAGIAWAFSIGPLFGQIVLAGLFFDVVVYTVWLKRRTCWSIVWGGISGALPVLAGRSLAVGQVDQVGIALALGVLFWIPTHMMTYSIRYQTDYETVAVPTFPARYGVRVTRVMIALSSVLCALTMALAGYQLGMSWGLMQLLEVLSAVLVILAARSMIKPSEPGNLRLFKYASIYMLGAMVLMAL